METSDFIDILRADGALMADLAERAGWDAVVPTCPEWRMRDLVGHLGNVHRWSAGYVAGETTRVPLTDTRPGDEGIAEWFREGHRALVKELTDAPADRECWTFMAAASPIAFWARRQAHETAIHRVDAESAVASAGHTPFAADFALDGIDELLLGMHTTPRSQVRTETPRTLLLRATAGPSAGRDWLLRLSQDPPRVESPAATEAAGADCTVSGPADLIYRALWNRSGLDEADVTGDASLVDLWHRTSAI